MKTNAALLFSQPGKWEVTEVDLDPPKEHEVLVKMVASGICHTDDHYCTGDHQLAVLPWCGGHEGAGIVLEVGPGVTHLDPGDHVAFAFIPGCGRCRWCAGGQQNLCDNGALILEGAQLDGTFRMHHEGKDVGQMTLISTFSEYTVVPAVSAVKIDKDIPFTSACLVGCGVPTGWGSAVSPTAGGVTPGDIVIVMGIGGVGINAVQGASHAGAARVIAVDPVEFKREHSMNFGATDACSSIEEADQLAREMTNGQGADVVIVTVGVTKSEHLGQAFSAVGKAGTLVCTGVGPQAEFNLPVSLFELSMYQKRIQGVIYGNLSPAKDMLRLLSLYKHGKLKLDELVTRTYTLDQVNDAYADMHAGQNLRGVITFDN